MKKAVADIAIELNPTGSNPNFGVFFYGASSVVHQVVPLGTTNSALVVKSKLDLKQYTPTQSQPSTLTSALDAVLSSCISNCRAPSRAVIVLTTSPDMTAAARI
ncbi:hypothetical protein I4U23_016460 [Adineta vaga]|nr:hypothetical protein I4U23_016460 [Adineta vaga]